MGRYRKYESANDRVRAWRARKRLEAAQARHDREVAERALRSQYAAEFEELLSCAVSSVLACPGMMPEVHGEVMVHCLVRLRSELEEAYFWRRRFPGDSVTRCGPEGR